MIRLERITGSKWLSWVSLIGVLMVPIVMAAGFLAATWDSTSRWDKVQAAIVNNDEPVRNNGQLVPLGRQLAGGLVDPENAADNLDWVMSNTTDAAAGLADGRYAAVITIPKNFSVNATSFTANDGDKAEHATIDVQTSRVSGVTDSAVADAISASAVSTLNGDINRQYLQNLYLGFNQTQQGMQQSADSAADLASEASVLTNGIGQSASGGATLADGVGQLSDSADDLTDDLQQTDAGARQLASGADDLAGGVKQAHDGVTHLDQRVGELDQRVTAYRKGVQTLADGLVEYVDGVDTYIRVIEPIARRVRDVAADAEKFLAEVNRVARDIARGIREYAGSVSDYVDGVHQYADDVSQFVDDIGPTADQVADGVTDQAAAQCAQQQLDAQQCQLFTAGVNAGAQGTATGVKQALLDSGSPGQSARGEQLVASSKKVTSAGEQLTASGARITDSAEHLGIDTEQLSSAGEQLPAVLKSLTKMSSKIKNGADQLVRSGDRLGTAGARLTGGANRLLSGAKQMAGGISALHDGTSRLAEGTGKLADRVDELSSGAAELSGGLGRLADGGAQLAAGADQSASASHRLSNGLDHLNDGGKTLFTSADKLANGLQHGADKLPTYSTRDRTRLAEVASQPVSSNQPDQQFTNGSTATLLMALALWIGGLITYLVVRAIGSGAFGSSKASAWLALEGVLPAVVIGAIQAVLLSGMLAVLFDLSVARFAGLLGFGLLAATTFAILNYALAAWLHGIGRLISLAVAVLAAAGALTDAVPDFLATTRPYLPITPALEGIRMIVTHGPSAGPQVAALLGWLAVGTVASIYAVARSRVANPVSLRSPARRPRSWVGRSTASAGTDNRTSF